MPTTLVRRAMLACLALLAAPPASALGTESLERSVSFLEYDVSRDGEAWSAPNRAQGLRARWSEGALTLGPRAASEAWSLAFELERVGRGARAVPVAPPESTLAASSTLAWKRGALDEWYRNEADGIAQGFTLHERPAGAAGEPLVLEACLDGLERGASFDEGLELGSGAERRVALDGLRARDAAGRALPLRLAAADGGLRIEVDDREAAYPVNVSGQWQGGEWQTEGEQTNGNYAFSIAAAGDVNGDGFGDLLVGAPFHDAGQVDEGAVFLFLGAPWGLEPLPVWHAESNQFGARLGYAVSTAGDVNGDGFDDVLAGADAWDNGQTDEGGAFLWLGGRRGPLEGAAGTALNAAWRAESNQPAARFGASVAGGGNFDGDRHPDVLVGAPTYKVTLDRVLVSAGAAFGWRGGPILPPGGPGSGLNGHPGNAHWSVRADQASCQLGWKVSFAGDTNGDDRDDILVGAPFYRAPESAEGRLLLYLGGSPTAATLPAWRAESNQISGQLGWSVAAGDTNGDGWPDLVAGCPNCRESFEREGLVLVWFGSEEGFGPFGTIECSDWRARGEQPFANLGWSVAVLGGACGPYATVLAGAPHFDVFSANEGVALGWLGSWYGPAWGEWGTPWNAWFWYASSQRLARLGACVASAGDVDGDGAPEHAIGAPYEDRGQLDEGVAYVWPGECDPCGGDC